MVNFRRWPCLFVVLAAPLVTGCAGAGSAGAKDTTADTHAAKLKMIAPFGDDRDQLEQAIELMDAGKLNQSIAILEQLRGRHPHNGYVLHELALAHRLNKQPAKAVAILKPYASQLPPELATGLGGALGEAGKREEAHEFLRAAIDKYPHSGLLYSELATSLRGAGRMAEAVSLYHRGMQAEPSWPSNYLHVAIVYSATRQRGLTLIYGETFRVLEPQTERSALMAKLMVDVCTKSVKLSGSGPDIRAKVSLADDVVVKKADGGRELPLPNAFELLFAPGLVLAHRDGLSIASLHRARESFLASWWKQGSQMEAEAVPIFRFLRDVQSAGHLKAYDHWLFAPAFPDEFEKWATTNEAAMKAFAQYMQSHPLFPRSG